MYKTIEPFRQGESITRGDVREHLNALAESHNDVVRRGGEVLGTPEPTVRITPSFWAKITGTSVCIGTHANGGVRWHYNWTYQVVGTAGWVDGTVNPFGALTGTLALNANEANNGTGGVQGNGIDISNTLFFGTGTTGFHFKEIRGNPVTRMWVERAGDVTVYTFELPNAVDGSECLS